MILLLVLVVDLICKVISKSRVVLRCSSFRRDDDLPNASLRPVWKYKNSYILNGGTFDTWESCDEKYLSVTWAWVKSKTPSLMCSFLEFGRMTGFG